MNSFTKDDEDKLDYTLLEPLATKELVKIINMGAKKYSRDNWKQCTDKNRYISALFRHLEAHRSGELKDPESGELHMSHVLTNAYFLTYLIKNEG